MFASFKRNWFCLSLLFSEDERLEGVFGPGTQQAVNAFQEQSHRPVSGIIDEQWADALAKAYELRRYRVIRGQVLHPDGQPVHNATVQLLDKRLMEEIPVAQSVTDGNGSYFFGYTAHARDVGDLTHLALRVALVHPNGGEPVTSDVLYGPGVEEIIDLRVPGDQQPPAEYERIGASLQPFLAGANVATLTDDQVTYLTRVSSLGQAEVATFVESAKLAHVADIAEDFAFVLRREGVATSREEVLESTQAHILIAIDTALSAQRISNETAHHLRVYTTKTLIRTTDQSPVAGA